MSGFYIDIHFDAFSAGASLPSLTRLANKCGEKFLMYYFRFSFVVAVLFLPLPLFPETVNSSLVQEMYSNDLVHPKVFWFFLFFLWKEQSNLNLN